MMHSRTPAWFRSPRVADRALCSRGLVRIIRIKPDHPPLIRMIRSGQTRLITRINRMTPLRGHPVIRSGEPPEFYGTAPLPRQPSFRCRPRQRTTPRAACAPHMRTHR